MVFISSRLKSMSSTGCINSRWNDAPSLSGVMQAMSFCLSSSSFFCVFIHFTLLLRAKWCIGQTLSLSYGRFFAEFLEDLSLVRLSLLDSTTCVGLRYGTAMFNPNEVFLGSVLLTISLAEASNLDPTRAIATRIYLSNTLIVPTPIQ